MKMTDRIFYTCMGMVLIIAVLLAGVRPFQNQLKQKHESKIAHEKTVLTHAGNWSPGNINNSDTILPSVNNANGVNIEDGYTSLEEITLGGVKQWVLIRGNASKPVLLFLHGGPGGAIMPWVNLFHTPLLEQNFLVVHWDQRGAGKSYNDSLKVTDISPEQLVSDTLELTNLLRERFNQTKIFLTGHSWGSALGFLTIAKDSRPYHAFIPTSERVAWQRSFTMGFNWAMAQAEATKDASTFLNLKAIEPFDPLDEADLVVLREAIDTYHGGDLYTKGLWDKYLSYVTDNSNPYYTREEIKNYLMGIELSSAAIERPDIVSQYDLFKSFKKSDIPVHFIMGDNDHNTPADLAFEYFNFLEAPNKSFTRINNAAHMVLWDQPLAWAKTLVEIKNKTLTNTTAALFSDDDTHWSK